MKSRAKGGVVISVVSHSSFVKALARSTRSSPIVLAGAAPFSIGSQEAADIASLCQDAHAPEMTPTVLLNPRMGIASLGRSRACH